jgi:transposase
LYAKTSSGDAACQDQGEAEMTISKESESEILRLFHVEKWKPGTIARQLQVHHNVVERVLLNNGVAVERMRVRRSMIDPYLPFIRSVLEKYPKLTASRLYAMVKERGYAGGADHFRDMVARHRIRPVCQAYLRLATLPGEQAQVDWASFGKVKIGNAERPLFGFVMVLSWSRQIFLKFYTGLGTANFLQGHVDGFEEWGGVPREVLYDNLKSAVLERIGDAIRFNPRLLELAAHYRFAPKPVAPARGNEKGRVERAIQYIRHSFFAARAWDGLDDLNNQARIWSAQVAGARECASDRQMTVAEAYEQEKASLIALPETPFPAHELAVVRVGKWPYIRFDLNDYSVPHEYVKRQLTVLADSQWVKIVDGPTEVAKHRRCFEKLRQIEALEHIERLKEEKTRAKKGSGMNRLFNAAPAAREFLKVAAERGQPIGSFTSKLLSLLDLYGAGEMEAALQEVVESGACHCSAVSQELERRRRRRGLLSPVAVELPADSRISSLVVVPHALASYDNLSQEEQQ